MKLERRLRQIHRQRGQTLVMFVFFIVVLILFVGLGVDLGFAYITKAQLSKAVDAAALMGARNIASGNATSIVQSVFAMNYGRPGRDTAVVTPNAIVITDSATNKRRMHVDATASINTFFIRLLPPWKTLTVSASAEAVRARAVLALILDRSGSMQIDGGCTALPPATDLFIDLFDDMIDKGSLVTFSSVANTIVTMRQPFKQAISNGVPRTCNLYSGATFMQDGLQHGFDQINTEPVLPGDSVVKAAVFFTDGLPNFIQETWVCNGVTAARNIGGYDCGSASYDIRDPATDTSLFTAGACTILPVNFSTMELIRTEARTRTKNLADQMRQAGITVYAIGLTSGIDPACRSQAESFLNELSDGHAYFAPTADQLGHQFYLVAFDILGRLTK